MKRSLTLRGKPRTVIGMKRLTLKPLCATCQKHRVKNWKARWCSQACVPASARQRWSQQGRAASSYRVRARFFRDEVQRLGPKVTQEDLLVCLQRSYRRGYVTGWHAGFENRQTPMEDIA